MAYEIGFVNTGLILQKESTHDARDENLLRNTVILVEISVILEGLVQSGRPRVKEDGLVDQTGRFKRLNVDSPKD